MKDSGNLHLKVQEFCDCFATTDPLKEMSLIQNIPDKAEAALKWLSLAALHGVNANADEIVLAIDAEGNVKATAEYRPAELPSPGKDAGARIFETLKQITHIEGDEGKTRLALGIRDSSIELKIKIKSKKGGKKIAIRFPE